MKLYSPTAKGMAEMLSDMDKPLGVYAPSERPPELIDDEGYYGSRQLDVDIKRLKEEGTEIPPNTNL